MTIINKTPHPVHVINGNDDVVRTFPLEGAPIRLKAESVQDEPIDGVPTSRTVFGEPEGLPEYVEGIFYIVRQLVKNALADRVDLLVPAEVVRDKEGNIIGCRSLGR